MNVLMLLKNKEQVEYLFNTDTIQYGLNKMREHRYAAIPVLTEEGFYAGCVSDGDFLFHVMDHGFDSVKETEQQQIKSIVRKQFNPAARVDISMDELLERSMNQNFIPIIDDRNYFIGIVTRQDIIGSILKERKQFDKRTRQGKELITK